MQSWLPVLGLTIASVVALVAYKEAAAFRATSGRYPWGIHAGVWAGAGFVSLLFAAILLAVAKATTRSLPGPVPPASDASAARPLAFSKGTKVFVAFALSLLSVVFTLSGVEEAKIGNGYAALATGLGLTAITVLMWWRTLSSR